MHAIRSRHQRSGIGFVGAIVIGGLTSGGVSLAAERVPADAAASLADRIVAAVGAKSVDCPADTAAFLPSRVLHCGTVSLRRRKLEAMIDATAADSGPTSERPEPRGRWDSIDGAARRFFDFPHTLLEVDFYRAEKVLVVSYPKPFALCDRDNQAPPSASDGERSVSPRVIRETQTIPSFPELGRLARVNALVVLRATVQLDGSLRDLCVLKGVFNGQLGYEYAAIDAVKHWRYEPAQRDGRPVEDSITIKIPFRFR